MSRGRSGHRAGLSRSGFLVAPAETATGLSDIMQQNATATNVTFTMQRGSYRGFAQEQGLYKFTSSGSDYLGGTYFTAENDALSRSLLADQTTYWGGQLRDAAGVPLPVSPQLYVNYPDKSAYGETGGWQMVYPIDLGPTQSLRTSRHAIAGQRFGPGLPRVRYAGAEPKRPSVHTAHDHQSLRDAHNPAGPVSFHGFPAASS